MYISIYIRIHIYLCMYIHIYIYIYTNIHKTHSLTHTHTHTHTENILLFRVPRRYTLLNFSKVNLLLSSLDQSIIARNFVKSYFGDAGLKKKVFSKSF